MTGRRLPDVAWDDYSNKGDEAKPGDYYKIGEKLWALKAPNGAEGTVTTAHIVVEHEDGTVSIMPSLIFLDNNGQQVWHGYLERGVWRSC